MKYFLDTEFIEGSQNTFFGKSKPTIDLISIGLVCENGQTYYAISKDFNLKHVWNNKDTWVKDNVLASIYQDCFSGDARNQFEFSYSTMKYILRNNGKSNNEIAKEIKQFVYKNEDAPFFKQIYSKKEIIHYTQLNTTPEFYGYYCDYDWVVFCWLFGNMLDLPEGFPMYCKDIKQRLDEYVNAKWLPDSIAYTKGVDDNITFDLALKKLKGLPEYPKETNEHNALSDAKWIFELFNFLQSIA